MGMALVHNGSEAASKLNLRVVGIEGVAFSVGMARHQQACWVRGVGLRSISFSGCATGAQRLGGCQEARSARGG